MTTRAQIVGTLGPVSADKETIQKMIEAGMDVARLNFSWGTHEEHAGYIARVREVARSLNKAVPIIQDLSGPREQGENGHHFKEGESPLTEKDKEDLKFGLSQNVEYVALSYVGGASDVEDLKRVISDLGGKARVIAKIERDEALANFDEILTVTDAIMIARGDLGNEIPVEEIPWYEKEVIKKCREVGKPVIVATQMMVSMVEKSKPTRAEVTDVFFAIENGADALMLSDETAAGKYPVEAVIMMEKAAREAEKHYAWEPNLL